MASSACSRLLQAWLSLLDMGMTPTLGREMARFTFLALLLTQVDTILLSKLLSLSGYGYYSLAATVAAALCMLIGPITQAWYPRLCELHAHGDTVALTDSYHKGAKLVSVIAGSVAIECRFVRTDLIID